MTQKLLLIDGFNIARKIYEAIPRPDSPDKAKGAVISCVKSITRALYEHEPTHVLAAFDTEHKNWRHEIYPEYKIKRRTMPKDLREAVPLLYQELKEIGIVCVDKKGFEAEDIIASALSHWSVPLRGPAIILSNDKDLLWLMTMGAQIRDHFKSEWRDQNWFEDRYGIKPDQFPDYQALTGDSVDDIPGIDKLGDKTAVKLLKEFMTLDRVLEEGPKKITGKLGERLLNEAHMARLSRQLVALKTDVSLGLTWNQLRYDSENNRELTNTNKTKTRMQP